MSEQAPGPGQWSHNWNTICITIVAIATALIASAGAVVINKGITIPANIIETLLYLAEALAIGYAIFYYVGVIFQAGRAIFDESDEASKKASVRKTYYLFWFQAVSLLLYFILLLIVRPLAG